MASNQDSGIVSPRNESQVNPEASDAELQNSQPSQGSKKLVSDPISPQEPAQLDNEESIVSQPKSQQESIKNSTSKLSNQISDSKPPPNISKKNSILKNVEEKFDSNYNETDDQEFQEGPPLP
jgi:isocitrate dehydrogenase